MIKKNKSEAEFSSTFIDWFLFFGSTFIPVLFLYSFGQAMF